MFKRVDIYSKDYNFEFYKLVLETEYEEILFNEYLATKTYTVLFKEFEDLKECVNDIARYNHTKNLLFYLHRLNSHFEERCDSYTINDMKKHFGKAIWKSEKEKE